VGRSVNLWTLAMHHLNMHKQCHLFQQNTEARLCVQLITEVAPKVEWQRTNTLKLYFWLASESVGAQAAVWENLLHAYTRHAGRKSRYKQQHIARRMHQLSVAACPLLGSSNTTCLHPFRAKP
jgi:hypothetical protein